jgi:hypothetical protein
MNECAANYESQLRGDWRETNNGNWVLIDGVLQATVYATEGSLWGGIWNGAGDGKARRLKEKCDSAEEACRAVESAIEEGESSLRWWPPDDTWAARKDGGCYRKLNGLVISVKQAKSKSWYVVNSAGALLGRSGRAAWFPTEGEARDAANASAAGVGDWGWVSRSR